MVLILFNTIQHFKIFRRQGMEIIKAYIIDDNLYHQFHHNLLLTTTEYHLKNIILVSQKIHSLLKQTLALKLPHLKNKNFYSKQEHYYFVSKTNQKHIKAISKSSFDLRIQQYKKNETRIVHEILEIYEYIDLAGEKKSIKIIINQYNDKCKIATISFESIEEMINFVKPEWLLFNNK